MNMITRKVCLLGDYGVGKTSLVSRFVHQQFSEKYQTTIGVKIDTKEVLIPGIGPIKLVIWDMAGTDSLDSLFRRYLRGAGGYLLVVDGTRADTLDNALALRREVEAQLGGLPFVGLLNKRDLALKWALPPERCAELRATGDTWIETSAKAGTGVARAFIHLTQNLVSD